MTGQTGSALIVPPAVELDAGTALLHGQYVIEGYLNNGGFGITYLAKDSLRRRVVIKECFVDALCHRKGTLVKVRSRDQASDFVSIVKLFVREARGLAKLEHPNIVGVHQVFQDNNTAYMALDYIEGRDLLDVIEDPETQFTPAETEAILMKLLDAVAFIHREGMLHRDISPDNILLRKSNEPVLIDFGAARETATRRNRALTALRVVKEGYSPQEFYVAGETQNQASDLYSLGASIYHLVTGEAPPDSQERLTAVAEGLADPYVSVALRAPDHDPVFLASVDKALGLFPGERHQTAAEWLEMLDVPQDEDAEADGTIVRTGERVRQVSRSPKLESRIRSLEPPPPPAGKALIRTGGASAEATQQRQPKRPNRPARPAASGEGAQPRRPAKPGLYDRPPEAERSEAAAPPPPEPARQGRKGMRRVAMALIVGSLALGGLHRFGPEGAVRDILMAASDSLAALATVVAPEAAPGDGGTGEDGAAEAADAGNVGQPLMAAAPPAADPAPPAGWPAAQPVPEPAAVVPRPADLAMPAAALAATAPAPDAPDAVPPASATTAETVTLWNGDVIRVAPTSEGWVHSVDSASESNRSGLRPGDIFVTYVPTRERIDGQGTLSGILEREIAAGTPALTFAVQRESEVLLVSLAPPT